MHLAYISPDLRELELLLCSLLWLGSVLVLLFRYRVRVRYRVRDRVRYRVKYRVVRFWGSGAFWFSCA